MWKGRSILVACVVLLGTHAVRADLHSRFACFDGPSGSRETFATLNWLAVPSAGDYLMHHSRMVDRHAGGAGRSAGEAQSASGVPHTQISTGGTQLDNGWGRREIRRPASVHLEDLFSGGLEPWAQRVEPAAPVVGHVVKELPSLPGSVELFCTGMLSLGAWQLARSTKNIGWGVWPSWNDPSSPYQMGASVSIDCAFVALPLCVFEEPITERPTIHRNNRGYTPRLDPQCCITCTGSRAPPVFSF